MLIGTPFFLKENKQRLEIKGKTAPFPIDIVSIVEKNKNKLAQDDNGVLLFTHHLCSYA